MLVNGNMDNYSPLGGNEIITINNGGSYNNYVILNIQRLQVNTGGALVNNGTLLGNGTIQGSITNTGILAPGQSPGSISTTTDHTSTPGSIHNFEVGGINAGQFDQLNATGNLNLDGTLNVSLINGFTPAIAHDIILFTGTINGSFSTVNIPASYSLIYNSNSVVLRFSTALPVNFVDFQAKINGEQLELKWKIENEHNVQKYEVQESGDGRNFSTLGYLDAGESPTYSYSINSPKQRTYYRIKSVDFDGTYKYSSILLINEGKGLILRTYPNPVTTWITVEHGPATGKERITISSIDGRILKTINPANGSRQTKIDMASWPASDYYITFFSMEGKRSGLLFVKQ
jgi:hypothetical protein